MKKIIELFNFLTIGAFLSVIILFIGDFFGFSLGINFQLLWRVLAGILALTVILNTGNIKRLLKISTTSKKFLLLSGLNLFLFALFLLFYPIFRFGSPFVWEDRIANFKAAKRIEITLNESLKQNFQAKSNNLGTIGLRIISKDVVVEEEKPEEATPSAELKENEETGTVQGINTEGKLDEELDGELYFGEPERIVFRIKEEEERDYFYENTYELNQYWETSYFLFGFPVQKNSEGKNYLFEIVKTKEGETNKIFLIEENSQGNFNFYPRYVYNLASLKTDWDPILLNISRKTTQFLEEKTNQFNLIFIFFLVEFLILVFLKKEEKYFKEKIIPIFGYVFLFLLLLIAIGSFSLGFVEIGFFQKIIDSLSIFNSYLILLAIFFGSPVFYFNKEKIMGIDLKENFLRIKKWQYGFILLVLIIAGFFYFYKLGNFGFQMDEYYHAKSVKSYFEEGFFDYNRSKITTYLGIISAHFFNIFNLNLSDEFILRFPITFFGLINIFLVFLISKLYTNRKVALLISLIFATEIWFIYFARYFRFYTPAITLTLLVMFLIKRYKFSIRFIFLSLFMAIIGYLYIENYLLLLVAWLCFLLIVGFVEKKKILMTIPILFVGGYFVLDRIIKALASTSTYDLISWSFKPFNMRVFYSWITYNYGIYFVLSLVIIPILIFSLLNNGFVKSIKKYFIEYYLLINLIFLFFYIVHVPFNFTFRPILFFLPLMFIVSLNYFYKIFFKDKRFFYTFSIFLIMVNIIFAIKYQVNSEGDKYFPTKPVYEKIDIVTGNKDLAIFLNEYLRDNYLSTEDFYIHYIGLHGSQLSYYLDHNFRSKIISTYRYTSSLRNLKEGYLSTLLNFLEENQKKDNILVVSANAYSNRINYLYNIFLDRRTVTEVDPAFVSYIESNKEFDEIYLSRDGYSKIFIIIRKINSEEDLSFKK
jgi:hypothetical protein